MRRAHDRVFVVQRSLAHRAKHNRPVEPGPRLYGRMSFHRKCRERVIRKALIEIAVRIVAEKAAARRPVSVLDVTAAAEKLQLTRAAPRLALDRCVAQLAADWTFLPDRFERHGGQIAAA